MSDLENRILLYAESIYEQAIQDFQANRFRMADIRALVGYGAAVFVAADETAPKDLRDHATKLEQAAWALSMEAHLAERSSLLEPRLQGRGSDELNALRRDVWMTAREISSLRPSSRPGTKSG
jgi:hypothetical protein